MRTFIVSFILFALIAGMAGIVGYSKGHQEARCDWAGLRQCEVEKSNLNEALIECVFGD
jgi:hypothetical protein